ncbi:UDP-N-acetylglucosamine 1-carboxyvinyltransferase [Aerococcus kribbianus]|uniref:UDP-N-acetylglucosamine 1-carboxyvinyltransferase n=1 Tax=Aerococcus kribbianus TaxID=2999064 RepID=A0A9X3JF58_9LACT|nr:MULTISPECIES: UDP-N-acetylglucosamine 1-carboxyvinyltransferase [unclassified Aerococcus]MCZ0717890.1 UDP-N-acetylglucosamine 1-carboxyvinyltransferase [Aerococcus sp. YH-aer221]MCZ0726177.1 UDP-N-acetylglucosamine 1-carboxyvinyltransferase [Aerococcus sp. YH-aer222]
MKKFIINGGKPLAGEVTVSGAKNSAVALIPAAIMADSEVVLEGVPDIQDVHALMEILTDFGCQVFFQDNVLRIDPQGMQNIPMPDGKIQSLRASYYFMGALLSKYGEGVVGLPGGCSLGPRPMDLHIKGFEMLGAQVDNEMGAMHLSSPQGHLTGADIYLDMVSVGATINILLAAVKAKGETVIENAAREPEIIDVVNLLNKMGANIKGAGTSTIRVQGVDHLNGVSHQIIPDRIEAGTYLSAAAAIGQGVKVNNVIYEHIESFVAKLNEMGVKLDITEESIYVHPKQANLKMVDIKTMPYPGFATDLQQPITPLLLMAEGHGQIEDTIYPKRVNHIPELQRMGAKAKVNNDQIFMEGPNQLTGAEVRASDLRAGACLINAGLIAQGQTTLTGVENILRGYDHIIDKFNGLGADIRFIED